MGVTGTAICHKAFGPIGQEGGERRLNVLISRAKRSCEVFSSITADDIDLERGKGAGVAALKLFLKYAQTGKLDYSHATDREADSVFEEQVAAALRARGYSIRTQIGIAGFFIDLAVADQDVPGRYIIGIECDGVPYHSSRSARDRDRLRQAVLEDHGWIIHRIWSTDWFRRPANQLEKAIAAIEAAKRKLSEKEPPHKKPDHAVFEIAPDTNKGKRPADDGKKVFAVPYREASVKVPSHVEPHKVSDEQMAEIVTKIVAAESPIHEDEVVTRVRMLWELGRAGDRIQTKVLAGLKHAVKSGDIKKEKDFYLKPGANVLIRDRSAVTSPGLRKPEYLPPHEINKAVIALIEANYGAARDQLPVEVARLLGFKATSPQLREVIDRQIKMLVKEGKLQETGEHLVISDTPSSAKA